MRRIHACITSILFALAAATFGVPAASAAITADFNAGAATFPDVAGSGWSNAWQSSAGLNATVTNADPLDGGTNYLSVDGTGAIRLVARQYESFDDVNVSQPHAISWSFRLDAPDLSQFTVFNDRINFFARGTAGLGGATSAADSWEILATGAPQSGAPPTPAQFGVFTNNDGAGGFTAANIVDTSMPLTPGDPYTFAVHVDPTQQKYAVRIQNQATGNVSVGNALGFRNTANPADSFTFLHLGGRTSAAADTMPYSLDSVNIAGTTGFDGVVNYSGTPGAGGGLEELTGLTVRRAGVDEAYTADELVGVTVTHWKGGASATNLLVPTGSGAPADRAALLQDMRLDTGLINPGGASLPLTSDPVIDTVNPANSTPGFAVMFNEAVLNAPGPDVVLFDIQTTSNPASGDPFHVSPLTGLDDGLNSLTVFGYDIHFGDPAALGVANFDLFDFTGGSPMTLDGLQMDPVNQNGGTRTGFQLLAAAFDLSDLGYVEGARVPGLFFQADGTGNVFDPVLIAGLPGPPIPEPATLALLGCGALALLRRRRRA
jgi:hypothetical protein